MSQKQTKVKKEVTRNQDSNDSSSDDSSEDDKKRKTRNPNPNYKEKCASIKGCPSSDDEGSGYSSEYSFCSSSDDDEFSQSSFNDCDDGDLDEEIENLKDTTDATVDHRAEKRVKQEEKEMVDELYSKEFMRRYDNDEILPESAEESETVVFSDESDDDEKSADEKSDEKNMEESDEEETNMMDESEHSERSSDQSFESETSEGKEPDFSEGDPYTEMSCSEFSEGDPYTEVSCSDSHGIN